MKVERWQDVNGQLVVDNDQAIIVKNSEILKDPEALKTEMEKNGQPVKKVRNKLIQKAVKQKIKTDPLKISGWFNRKNDSKNAKKTEKLQGNKPVRQYKQIKNEIQFFGESFLEGFLDFYGLEVDNAVGRYEKNLHVLETQELGKSEKEYYLAQIKGGESNLATKNLPSREIAEQELNKFYGRSQEEKLSQTQALTNAREKEE